MFIRHVNGRAYIAESVRVGGRPTQRHYGPAIPGMLEMLQADQDKIRQEQREQQKPRDEEHEKDHLIADHHQMVQQEFEATMKAGCTSAFARAGGGVKSSMGEFQILW